MSIKNYKSGVQTWFKSLRWWNKAAVVKIATLALVGVAAILF